VIGKQGAPRKEFVPLRERIPAIEKSLVGRKNSHRHYLTLGDGQPLFVTLVGE
jgi:hypothetical protein